MASLALIACRPNGDPKPESPDVVAPRAQVDSGSAPRDGATSAKGWMRDDLESEPTYADRAAVLDAIRKAQHRAVLVHDETIEECSGLGGAHALFTIVEPGKGVAHFGGHGARLVPGFTKGEIWVAAYVPLASPESVKNSAFCVPDRSIDARVLALVPVATREEGSTLLHDLSR